MTGTTSFDWRRWFWLLDTNQSFHGTLQFPTLISTIVDATLNCYRMSYRMCMQCLFHQLHLCKLVCQTLFLLLKPGFCFGIVLFFFGIVLFPLLKPGFLFTNKSHPISQYLLSRKAGFVKWNKWRFGLISRGYG